MGTTKDNRVLVVYLPLAAIHDVVDILARAD